MNMRQILNAVALIAIAGILVMAAGCKKQTASPFPASNEVTGWARVGEARTFAPANLSDYIDGDAEKYISAGVKSTSTSDYKFRDKIEAVVDIYTMSNAEGAKTVFESDPAGNATTPQLGDAARAYSQSVMFRKGAYFVRIVAYQESLEAPQALLDLGRSIERKLAN